MQRHTFYGRTIDYNDLSHQHLSNILWFNELLLRDPWKEDTTEVEQELSSRFGGIKLPYAPMRSFKQEVDSLFEKGYITNKHESDVIVNGKWVGKLKYN